MNALEILETIEGRGGKISVCPLEGGAAKIQISPRGLVGDLAGEIVRFKPALLELLTAREKSGLAPIPQRAATNAPEAPKTALNRAFWLDLARVIVSHVRTMPSGAQFLGYSPALGKAWRATNELEGRALSSRELLVKARAELDKWQPNFKSAQIGAFLS